MKKYIYIMMSVVLASLFTSCSKENPFEPDAVSATGSLYTGGISISLQNENGPRSLKNRNIRAKAPAVADFTVAFYKAGSDEAEAVYKYTEMPEIVTLPVGTYTAKAFYGENLSAAWENPYYEGNSSPFRIEADEITEDVEPIVCRLANIRVSINFTDTLKAAMADDCKVEVKVGESGSLEFTKADVEKSGYFAYVAGSNTLTATFTGNVDGAYTVKTKAYDDVQPGNHYSITFRLFDAGEEDPGFIEGNGIIDVNASVSCEDMNTDVETGEETMTDGKRPQDGGVQSPDPGPGTDVPDDGNGPEITAEAPIDLNVVNDVWRVYNSSTGMYDSGLPVVLNITSSAPEGITGFKVNIISKTLDKKQLEGVGLTDELDLVNPGQFTSGLQGLGFLGEGVTTLKGEKNVKFSVTGFIPLLCVLGIGENHEFKLTVTDANGTTVRSLKLHTVADR